MVRSLYNPVIRVSSLDELIALERSQVEGAAHEKTPFGVYLSAVNLHVRYKGSGYMLHHHNAIDGAGERTLGRITLLSVSNSRELLAEVSTLVRKATGATGSRNHILPAHSGGYMLRHILDLPGQFPMQRPGTFIRDRYTALELELLDIDLHTSKLPRNALDTLPLGRAQVGRIVAGEFYA